MILNFPSVHAFGRRQVNPIFGLSVKKCFRFSTFLLNATIGISVTQPITLWMLNKRKYNQRNTVKPLKYNLKYYSFLSVAGCGKIYFVKWRKKSKRRQKRVHTYLIADTVQGYFLVKNISSNQFAEWFICWKRWVLIVLKHAYIYCTVVMGNKYFHFKIFREITLQLD